MTPDVFIPPHPGAFYTSTRMSDNGMTPAVMDHFLNPRNVDDIVVMNVMPVFPAK